MISQHICALDIGSSKISAAVAEIKKKRVTQLFCETVASKGIKRGSVVDSVSLVTTIGQLIKRLKEKSKLPIKCVYTNFSGQDVLTKHSRAIIPLSERGNKVITLSDIQRVNDQAFILGSNLEEEILHKIPFSYSIDSKSNIINPLGLYSHKLEVDLYLICSKLSPLQSFSHALSHAGYEIKGLSFSGLATSEFVLSRQLRTGTVLFCDIGADITELLLYKDGMLKNIDILPVGGADLTVELSERLNIPLDFAEEIKVSYGSIGDNVQIGEDKEILVKKEAAYEPIKQREVCAVVTDKARRMCQTLRAAIEKQLSVKEVTTIVVCGRTVLLDGFLETLESTVGIPAVLARITHPDMLAVTGDLKELSGQKYLTYLGCLSIIQFSLQEYKPLVPTEHQPVKNPVLKALHKVRDVYQEYF